jgi:uncharacterized membrane protein YjgN (DUF898 family)
MDEELKRRLDVIELKLDATFRSAEKSRKYLMWTAIVTVAVFVLPLIAMFFVLPSFISTYTGALGGQQSTDLQSLMQGL